MAQREPGWYRLVVAKTYLRIRPEAKLIIIDSDHTVWRRDRLYVNIVAQMKLGLFNYTTRRCPKGATANSLVTGQMIHNYLQTYAEDHGLVLQVRFNTVVEKAEWCDEGWRLSFRDSDEGIVTEKLMVATRVSSIPNLSEYDTGAATVPIIHSKDIGVSYEALRLEKV